MSLPAITAEQAARLQQAQQATLVDIREDREYRRLHVPGSVHLPLSRLADTAAGLPASGTVVFLCASGGRTTMYAAQLAARLPGCRAQVMQGGIGAWMAAGLPVTRTAPQPIMQRLRNLFGG